MSSSTTTTPAAVAEVACIEAEVPAPPKRHTSRSKGGNGKGGSRWIRPVKRLAIYLRDGFACLYCGADLHGAPAEEVSLDHVRCRSTGRRDNRECNLVTACRSCNSSRQDKSLHQFVGPEVRATVRKHCRRKLRPYRQQAEVIMAGRTPAVEQAAE